MLQQATHRRTARTPEGKLRQRVHSISRGLGLCDDARRNVLYSLTGERYCRNLNGAQLELVVAWLEVEAVSKRRPAYSAAELAAIHNAQSVEELLA